MSWDRLDEILDQFIAGAWFDEEDSQFSIESCDEVISNLRNLGEIVDKEGLISPNENLEEIHTSSLKFLLIPYLIGALTYMKPSLDNRTGNLTDSILILKYFKLDLETREFLREQSIKNYETLFSNETPPTKPALRRAWRIQKDKDEDEASAKLKAAQSLLKSEAAVDEEVLRDFYLSTILRALVDASRIIFSASEEMPLAEIRESKLREENETRKEDATIPTSNAPLRGMKPFLITSSNLNKEDLRRYYASRVFQPHVGLPPRTTAEAADWEKYVETELMGTKKPKEKNSDGSSSEDEGKTLEKREWDDWKDSNPRGYGNTWKLR